MRRLIMTMGLATAALSLASCSTYGSDYGPRYGNQNPEVRQELRECRRELRQAENRREYQRELRECSRELRRALKIPRQITTLVNDCCMSLILNLTMAKS